MKGPEKNSSFEPPAGLLDFNRLGQIALRRWWLPMLGMALGIAAGWYYLSTKPKMYLGVAVVQVEQESHEMMKFQDATSNEDFRAADVVKTFEQVLSNGALLLDVVRVNGLDKDPDFAPVRTGSPVSDSELIERMSGKVAVEIRRGTRLIDIRVEDRDPQRASRLANSLVDEYFKQEVRQKLDVTRGTGKVLAAEEARLRANLEESERKLAEYRAQHQAVSLEEKQNIVVEKLRELSAKVTEAKSQRLALEADIARINAGADADPERLLQLASIGAVPAVADLRRQINDKEGEFAAIKERYMYKHMRYKEAQSSLEKLRMALGTEVSNAANVINRSYQSARETETKLEEALHDQEQVALGLDKTAIPYNALLRESQTNRALYESVLTRMKEAKVEPGTDTNNLRVVQAATVPYHPYKPLRSKVLALAALGGGFLGTGIVLALELLNHTLQSVDQAEGLLGLPLLAAIPEWKRKKRGSGSALLIGAEDTPQREAFRTLRTTLATQLPGEEVRSFLFTSAVPGEGKSFCSLNFAATLARQGCQTLFIAADLRRPTDYSSLLQGPDQPGLNECLADGCPLAQANRSTKVPNLFLCPAGGRPGEPAALLAGKRFQEVVREALGVFDRVVIDTPPINAVSDCLLMAPHAQAVCLVTRAGFTPVNAILRACRILARAGVTPAGFVLNRLSSGLGAQGAYYQYGDEYHEAERAQGNQARPR